MARGLIASVSFFAATSVLVIGGLIGLLGAADTVVPTLQRSLFFGILQAETQAGFEIEVALLLVLFVQAFFKFGWSIRLHACAAVLIGAMRVMLAITLGVIIWREYFSSAVDILASTSR